MVAKEIPTKKKTRSPTTVSVPLRGNGCESEQWKAADEEERQNVSVPLRGNGCESQDTAVAMGLSLYLVSVPLRGNGCERDRHRTSSIE